MTCKKRIGILIQQTDTTAQTQKENVSEFKELLNRIGTFYLYDLVLKAIVKLTKNSDCHYQFYYLKTTKPDGFL